MHSGITELGISQCYIGSFMHSGITALGISQCYIGSFMHYGITALGISQCLTLVRLCTMVSLHHCCLSIRYLVHTLAVESARSVVFQRSHVLQ